MGEITARIAIFIFQRRVGVIGALVIVTLRQFGWISSGAPAGYVDPTIYGYGALLAIAWLTLTLRPRWRYGWVSRTGAVFTAAVLIGLGIDLLPAASAALFVAWWGFVALGEIFVYEDCV